MMVSGVTADEVLRVVEGIPLRRAPVQRGAFWSLTVRARSREARAAGYAAICARIFEVNPAARIEPCWVGGTLFYGGAPTAPEGISVDRWAEFNRKFCALLHRGGA